MKISAVRRKDDAPAASARAAPGGGAVALLGVPETELTPAVRAALASLVIELSDLRTEVQQLRTRLTEAEAAADEDPLTSARNRRAFVRALQRAAAFAQRYGSPASLVYFDVDDLKGVNDRLGHAAGDAVLKTVADRLANHVREGDVVARIGGDEFAVLLEQADLATAQAKAEALAWLVAAEPASGAWPAPIRLSWGARQIDPSADPETLIAEADAAMFAMKRQRGAAA
jgi:diguanylate cyclase (GGDEF)-like protein